MLWRCNELEVRFVAMTARLADRELALLVPSNGLRVDPVALPVRADDPDVDDAIGIIYPNHDTVIVA